VGTVLGATTQITLRPTRPPLPRPLSPAAREKGENSIAPWQGPDARGSAPSGRAPLAHLPQKPLGRLMAPTDQGGFEGHLTASAGGPSPGPSPLVPRGEGRIRSRFDSFGARHPSPTQFVGEGPGMGGARPSLHSSRSALILPNAPLPRSWGRGRPPLRGTSKRPGGGEGPRGRSENPAVFPTTKTGRTPHRVRPARVTVSPLHRLTPGGTSPTGPAACSSRAGGPRPAAAAGRLGAEG
jgi:hypothetical protein